MLKLLSKDRTRRRIHERIRQRARGGTQAPRLNVFRSTSHIYAQLVDDSRGHTLVAVSSRDKEVRQNLKNGANVAAAKTVGQALARRAKEVGIARAVFDPGGLPHHGRGKPLADRARERGLEVAI